MVKGKRISGSSRGITKESMFHSDFLAVTKKVQNNVKRFRKKRGLTQENMQDYELNLRQFQRIESGETQNMTLANLFKIARALKVDIQDLFS